VEAVIFLIPMVSVATTPEMAQMADSNDVLVSTVTIAIRFEPVQARTLLP
jgi:hypothetical protein